MVPGRGRVGGEKQDVRNIVSRGEVERPEVQNRRHEDDPGQVHAETPPLKVAGETRGPRGPVAFPQDEFRGQPPVVSSDVETDELPDGFNVFLDAVELLRFFPGKSPAESRGDGVDADDVGNVQESVRVVDQLERRGKGAALIVEHDLLGAECSKVEPDRGGAGAAVESEGQRTAAHVFRIVPGVGHIKHVGLPLSLFRSQGDVTGCGRVGNDPVFYLDRMVGDGDDIFFEVGGIFRRVILRG